MAVPYKKDFHPQMAKWMLRAGKTMEEIAAEFTISLRTLYRWQETYTEFEEVLKGNRFFVDMMVEDSLLKRALGHKSVERHIEYEPVVRGEGADPNLPREAVQVKRRKVIKHVAPDVVACIFWLKNRRPEDWRDVQKHEFTGKDEMTKREQKRVTQAVLKDPEALRLANKLQRRVAGYTDGDGQPSNERKVSSVSDR